ncbi:MAG: trypsin-like peptidase domain-containing protein [Candidatus Poribacteria bacterium]|nr:trypsin-like peptidase domain-containing protein [Candidatus Poribacteria bacterium]
MNIYIKLITFSLVFLFSTLSSALAQSVPQLAKKALAATVSLTVQDRSGNTLRRGSGFFIQEDLIATTLHVIEGDVRVSAILTNSETKHRTHVTATDEANNLALLKVRGHGITPLDLSDSDKVRSGETVYVPQASLGTVSVSTIRNRRNIDTKNERLRLTDSYWSGNSGAPLLNLEGKVIGIFVSNYGARGEQRSNLALPSNALRALLTRSPRGKEPVPKENKNTDSLDSRPDVPQLVKIALAATVSLTVQDRNGNTLRRGCGFFIKEDLIATTFRVIEGDVRVNAVLVNSETTYRTDVTAFDKINNLALLKVTERGVRPLPLADSDTVWPSETVYIPKAFLGTVSVNSIRGRRDIDTKKERLQMTNSIWSGNSGAPLLNPEGKVVGMFVSNYGARNNQTSNLAIPSNALEAFLTRPPRVEPVPDRDEKPDLPDRPPTVPDLAKIALAATVSLEVRNKSGVLLGSGSGFFVQRDLIATHYHVIEGAAKVSATIVNSKTMYRIEGVTATDEAYDLALLKVVG